MSNRRPNGDNLINFIATTVETMREQMATKKEVARLESKLDTGLTTISGDFEQVHLRFDTIERALSTRMGQIETEVSRLRRRDLSFS